MVMVPVPVTAAVRLSVFPPPASLVTVIFPLLVRSALDKVLPEILISVAIILILPVRLPVLVKFPAADTSIIPPLDRMIPAFDTLPVPDAMIRVELPMVNEPPLTTERDRIVVLPPGRIG
ncbi:hypothetical protein AGMMS49546_03920 [Spirochaetia bacterium]|nr:hypothetical protein AGMMS49546_03920 [Spirochaetia bacterium]